MSQTCHMNVGLIYNRYLATSIYRKWHKLEKKDIHCILSLVVDCTVTFMQFITQYRLFEVPSIGLDMFSDPCNQGKCNYKALRCYVCFLQY
jgi:hypothetical protein